MCHHVGISAAAKAVDQEKDSALTEEIGCCLGGFALVTFICPNKCSRSGGSLISRSEVM